MKDLDYGKLLSDYGNVLVLLILCLFVSFVTLEEQSPRSEAAAERLAKQIASKNSPGANVAILVRSGEGAEKFSKTLETALTDAGLTVTTNVIGNPAAARAALESQAAPLAAIAADEHMIVFCNELLPSLPGISAPRQDRRVSTYQTQMAEFPQTGQPAQRAQTNFHRRHHRHWYDNGHYHRRHRSIRWQPHRLRRCHHRADYPATRWR